jgi:D-3-phosphoglycerate dehydrogenase
MGLIGSATARKARGIGFDVIGHDRLAEAGLSNADGIPYVSIEELYARSDIVSLHVPLSADTHHLVDAHALARFRDGALLINTSRGGIVDTGAVAAALSSGKLRGAGLDVFEQEPLPSDHPLAQLETTVLTPHVAWYSAESYNELKRRTIENVVEYCAGRRPRNIVNGSALERKVPG